jgi:hypothetical protein
MDASRSMGRVPPMTSKWYQKKRRSVPRGQDASNQLALPQDHGTELPIRPPSMDPIVAEIIVALARTIIRDEDRRASLSLSKKRQ